MHVLPSLALAFSLLLQSPTPTATPGQTYKVDIVTPPADTPLFKWYLAFTAAGVIVNAAIFVLILKQTKLNRVAADAAKTSADAATLSANAAQQTVGSLSGQLIEMEKAANAAKDSADALAGSERAWILVDLTPPVNARMLTHLSSKYGDAVQEDSIVLTCLLTCSNHGKTPALNVEPMMRFDIFDEMPKELEFGDWARFQGSTGYISAIGPGEEKQRGFVLKAAGLKKEGQVSLAYGLVKYIDIFGKQRITTFGLIVFGSVDIHPIDALGCNKIT